MWVLIFLALGVVRMSIWNEKRRKWLVAVLVVGASDTADRSVRTHPSFTLDAATHHLTLPNKVSRNRKRMSDKNRNETSEAVTPPATTNIMQITSSNYQSRRWNLTGTANWTRRFENRAFEYSFVCTCTPWAIKNGDKEKMLKSSVRTRVKPF